MERRSLRRAPFLLAQQFGVTHVKFQIHASRNLPPQAAEGAGGNTGAQRQHGAVQGNSFPNIVFRNVLQENAMFNLKAMETVRPWRMGKGGRYVDRN
jgi:hypothetical protein